MRLIINGETRDFESDMTLKAVIEALDLEGKVMAAAVNMNIVKQADWEGCELAEEDKIELLDFVGGG